MPIPVQGNSCPWIWSRNASTATKRLHELRRPNGDSVDGTVDVDVGEAEAMEQSADLKRFCIFRDRGDPRQSRPCNGPALSNSLTPYICCMGLCTSGQ